MKRIDEDEFYNFSGTKQTEILYKWTLIHGNTRRFPGVMPSAHCPMFRKWCNEHESEGIYYSFGSRFYFEDPDDAMLFALTWS